MATLTSLRQTIRTNYLDNDVISAREARDLVRRVAGDNLTPAGKAQLETLKTEFGDKFSAAGSQAFESALGSAVAKSSHFADASAGTGGQSALNVRSGVNLENLPTSFKLSEIQDPEVKRALRRMDLNIDGKVDYRDRDKMGFSDEQFRMFIFSALLMGAEVGSDSSAIPDDLTGKKVCFSAVGDTRAKAEAWARAMGAEVVSEVEPGLDFLFVGEAGQTGKDERAQVLNTLGHANIAVIGNGAFLQAAHRAGVTGPAPTAISSQEFDAIVRDTTRNFYMSFLEGSYADDLARASSPAERQRVLDAWEADKGNYDFMIEPNDYWTDRVADQYANGEPYLDKFGRPVPEDDVEIDDFQFFTDHAGIGLSKVFVFDRRTGELLDEGDIMD